MTNRPIRDLDMSDVEADAANDPSLNRVCEEDAACTDLKCPLIHTIWLEDLIDPALLGEDPFDEEDYS